MDFSINDSSNWDKDTFSSTLHKSLFGKPQITADKKKEETMVIKVKKRRKYLQSYNNDKQVSSNSYCSDFKKQKQIIDLTKKSNKINKTKKQKISQNYNEELSMSKTEDKVNKCTEEKQNPLGIKQRKPNKRNKYKHLIQRNKTFQNSTSNICLKITEPLIKDISEKIHDTHTSFNAINLDKKYQAKEKNPEISKNSVLVNRTESEENILMNTSNTSPETAKTKRKRLKKSLSKKKGLEVLKDLSDCESTFPLSVTEVEGTLSHPVKRINAERKKKKEKCSLDIGKKKTFDKEHTEKKAKLPKDGLQCKFKQFNQEKFQKAIEDTLVGTHHKDQKYIIAHNNMNTSITRSLLLKEKATKCLQAAKFRFLNQKLYTVTGNEALQYFTNDNIAFIDYHKGYHSQVEKWPINPVDLIIEDLSSMSKTIVVADLGCGDAKIARTFPKTKIHSFDLIALNEHVTACDMAKIPLQGESVDVAIFCLSLMGTNLNDYIFEAHRILKSEGILKIAEVESRIEDIDLFIESVQKYGFELIDKDLTCKMFVLMNFRKIKKKLKKCKMTIISLKPCLYKKR